MNQDHQSYDNMSGIKSGFGKRKRRDAANEFEEEANSELETQESNLKPIKIKEKSAKEFKEFALPSAKEEENGNKNEMLPKPSFLKTSTLQELNSTKPKPETSQQVISQKINTGGGVVYPTNSDLSAYTIPYQLYYKQPRDIGYSGNGYSYNDPSVALKNNYLANQFYGGQDIQSLSNSSYMMNNPIMNNMMSSSSNQIYNPFLSSFNNFGKSNSIRPLMNDDLNKNYWHPPFDQSNKPISNNIINNQLNNQLNQASLNKVDFAPPRSRQNLHTSPKITTSDEMNSLANDVLHYGILVDDKKNLMNKENFDNHKKSNIIERKMKPKASIDRNYQSQYIEQCNTGPIILYTSLLITLIYIGLTACGYFYYSRYVKRYADQKLLVSNLGSTIPIKVNNDKFNFQLPPVHRSNQLNFDTRPTSLFHSNLNGTIRSLSSSTTSGFNPVFTQNFQTKAKLSTTSSNQKPKLVQDSKLVNSSKEQELNNRKMNDNFTCNKSGFNKTNKFKLEN